MESKSDKPIRKSQIELTEIDELPNNRETIQLKAIQYATQQGNRSGRIANQFAKMIVGQEMLSAADLTV